MVYSDLWVPQDEVEELLYDYCQERELVKSTIRQYRTSLEMFKDRFGYFFTKENGLEFKRQLVAEGKSPKTINIRLLVFNIICDLQGHPKDKVRQMKLPHKRTVENVISLKEFKMLSESLLEDGKYRLYWMIQYLAKTGCRVSELVQLTKSDLEAGIARVYNKGRIREVYIPENLVEDSKEYFAGVDSNWLFPSRHSGKVHVTARGVAALIKENGVKYGIRPDVLHPHSFRHFFAIQVMKETKDISLVSDLLNHASLSTTQIYLRQTQKEQIRRLNRAVKW